MKEHIFPVLASQRRRLGMSQQQLAAHAGLRRERLNRIESKNQNVGFDELCRLLDVLGLELYVREKGQAGPPSLEPVIVGGNQSHPPRSARHLVPHEFREASFIDGSKAKILNWGKVPR
jgi:transcriptional regulator with XRE-family HTH domain